MKVVILAGGYGTRISEESAVRPKPMVTIGDRPILWHIMKGYSHFGFHKFVICTGYKEYVIKEYFSNYFLHQSDVTFDFSDGNTSVVHNHTAEPWSVTVVNTGLDTMTGGRVKRVAQYLDNTTFMLTYGDGVANVNIKDLLAFHRSHGKLATVTVVRPMPRFGLVTLDGTSVAGFEEKPNDRVGWVNGGFFVMEPEVLDYIDGDPTILERDTLVRLVRDGQLQAFKHTGFWQPMDTLRDRMMLEEQWQTGKARWRVWDESRS